MTLYIRFYRADDFEPVTRLWRRAREAAMPDLTARMGYPFKTDQAFFAEHIVASCDLWVVEQDGLVAAFMGINKDFINHLYVAPDHHRQGIGRFMLEHARDLSHDHLWLYTHTANFMARAFYENNGFVATKFGTSPAPENEPDVEYHWYRPE
jgi:GNAT superfamily N-acetyltransferase